MKRILIVGQGSYTNRGCEAIIKTTTQIIKHYIPEAYITVATYDYKYNKKIDIKTIDKLTTHASKRFSLIHLMSYFIRKIGKEKISKELDQMWFKKVVSRNDILISVGGDNYCYDEPKSFFKMNKIARLKGLKTVFWGASVTETKITPDMKNDLKGFSLIGARENITYKVLKNINDNTFLMADTAFILKKKEVCLSEEFERGNVLGINISPLSFRYSKSPGRSMDVIENFIEYILNTSKMKIALIPHVYDRINGSLQNDLDMLDKLFERFKHTNRIIYFNKDYDCNELKYIISECRFFITARTHASIAAYSSYIPTLVIGYSVKARGIAQDIFGTEEGYVLSIQELKDENQLIQIFNGIMDKEKEIRDHLKKFMPSYINKAWQGGKDIKQLLED